MSVPSSEERDAAVLDTISTMLEPGEMAVSYMLLVGIVDSDGNDMVMMQSMRGQPVSVSLGLIEWIRAGFHRRVHRMFDTYDFD
ncbi:MAG: hypothetical protein ACOYOQ_00495 [Microthrixaceae bacterium]